MSPSDAPPWSRLSVDVVELILSYLPLCSIIVAGAVCKQWRRVVIDPGFAARASSSRRRRPWFFLYGQKNVFLYKNQAYGFDPDAGDWITLPPSSLPSAAAPDVDCFTGAGGFSFAFNSAARFCYAPLLRGPWRETSPLRYSRCNPLVGAFTGAGGLSQFVVVGGTRFVGGLVNFEESLAVEIYDPAADAWEICSPLPPDFRPGNSLHWLSAALVCERFFFVFGIHSSLVAAFDLRRRTWTAVRTLRPPGVLFSFLLASGDRLVLAGLCSTPDGLPCFALWAVDHHTLEYAKIGVMPGDLMSCLLNTDDDNAFAGLKCVGLDGLVYFFNDEHHKAYPACVCEIHNDASGDAAAAASPLSLECTWKKLPPLPGSVDRFRKVTAFCSSVPLQSVLGSIQ